MKTRIGGRHITMLLATLAVASTGLALAAAGRPAPQNVAGVWYGTTYLGDPNDPNTPKLQFSMTLHTDRTVLVSATDHTGEHPIFLGESTPGHGVWTHAEGNQLSIRFFEFSEGDNPPATFNVLRVSAACAFNDDGELVGTAGVDSLACPNGPLGCPSPNESPFPAPDMFPFEMERLQ